MNNEEMMMKAEILVTIAGRPPEVRRHLDAALELLGFADTWKDEEGRRLCLLDQAILPRELVQVLQALVDNHDLIPAGQPGHVTESEER